VPLANLASRRVLALVQAHRVAASVALASSALTWGDSSNAAEQPWREFSWRAPEACPERDLVLHQLERLLQQHPVVLSSADVRGDIERVGGSWVLSLDVQVGTERRVRRLSAPSCEVLADAAAVALVLLLEPTSDADSSATPISHTLALAEPTPTPVGLPAATPAESESAAGPAAAEPDATEASTPRWKLGAALVLDSSSLAAPAPALNVETQLGLESWAVAAYGILLPARRLELARGDSVDFALWAAGLRLCRAVWHGAVQVDACAGAELGRFTGRGTGLNRTQNEVRDGWFAPNVGARLTWHALPHAALLGGIDAVFPVLQEVYVINGGSEVHDTPAATVRASIGLAFDLL
jgi:hypothetical protein